MHVPIRRGRAFTAADRDKAPPVVIINDEIAAKYFKGQDPIGQRLTFDKVPNDSSQWSTIVGVVGGERQQALSVEPLTEVYIPFAQETSQGMSLLTRMTGDPESIGPALRRIVSELEPDIPISDMRTMETIRVKSLGRERFLMTMLVIFAGVGLLLAVIGVYGVLAQVARRRTREMGIRIALGSPIGQVRWLVVKHGLGLVTLGVAIGISAALIATRGLAALLYHVAPADPVTFVAIPLLLALTGVVAAWIPALQASRADPADDLFAAEFLQIVRCLARTVGGQTLIAGRANLIGQRGGGEAVGVGQRWRRQAVGRLHHSGGARIAHGRLPPPGVAAGGLAAAVGVAAAAIAGCPLRRCCQASTSPRSTSTAFSSCGSAPFAIWSGVGSMR
jgi:hypothetical protein